MSVSVSTPGTRNVTISSPTTNAAYSVKKGGQLTIQSLSNVDSTNLQDGYSLVYDSDTGKWVAQAVTAAVTGIVDGGTY